MKRQICKHWPFENKQHKQNQSVHYILWWINFGVQFQWTLSELSAYYIFIQSQYPKVFLLLPYLLHWTFDSFCLPYALIITKCFVLTVGHVPWHLELNAIARSCGLQTLCSGKKNTHGNMYMDHIDHIDINIKHVHRHQKNAPIRKQHWIAHIANIIVPNHPGFSVQTWSNLVLSCFFCAVLPPPHMT